MNLLEASPSPSDHVESIIHLLGGHVNFHILANHALINRLATQFHFGNSFLLEESITDKTQALHHTRLDVSSCLLHLWFRNMLRLEEDEGDSKHDDSCSRDDRSDEKPLDAVVDILHHLESKTTLDDSNQ